MKIGGKDRTIKCGLNQSFEYCELRKISISEMNADLSNIAKGDGSQIRDLIWSALKDGARIENVEFEYTNYDIGDWLETIDDGEIEKFFKDYLKSLPKPKNIKKNNQKK